MKNPYKKERNIPMCRSQNSFLRNTVSWPGCGGFGVCQGHRSLEEGKAQAQMPSTKKERASESGQRIDPGERNAPVLSRSVCGGRNCLGKTGRFLKKKEKLAHHASGKNKRGDRRSGDTFSEKVSPGAKATASWQICLR